MPNSQCTKLRFSFKDQSRDLFSEDSFGIHFHHDSFKKASWEGREISVSNHGSRREVKRFIGHRQKSTTDATPKSTISPLVRSRCTQSRLLCLSKFGFLCNPNLPTWNGAKIVLQKMPLTQLFNLYKSSQTALPQLMHFNTSTHRHWTTPVEWSQVLH